MTAPTPNDAKTNGHADPATRAWHAHLARIERRLAEIAESGEQRIEVLRDAIGDFCAAELAQRDRELVTLKKHIAELEHKLEQKSAVDEQVHEISARLEEKAARRDEAKRGPQGARGPRGEKGDRGAPGAPGKNGTITKQIVKIERWDIDRATFTVRGFLSDGSETPELNLRSLFAEYQSQTGE